jgi:hypothetical protein
VKKNGTDVPSELDGVSAPAIATFGAVGATATARPRLVFGVTSAGSHRSPVRGGVPRMDHEAVAASRANAKAAPVFTSCEKTISVGSSVVPWRALS